MKKWRLYKELVKHARRSKQLLRTIEEQEATIDTMCMDMGRDAPMPADMGRDAPMPADMWRDSAKEPPEPPDGMTVLVCYTGAQSPRPAGASQDYVETTYSGNVAAYPEQYPYWQPLPKVKVIS